MRYTTYATNASVTAKEEQLNPNCSSSCEIVFRSSASIEHLIESYARHLNKIPSQMLISHIATFHQTQFHDSPILHVEVQVCSALTARRSFFSGFHVGVRVGFRIKLVLSINIRVRFVGILKCPSTERRKESVDFLL